MRAMRASGLPVSVENLDKYQEEFRKEFDKLDAKYTKIEDKMKMQKPLEDLEKRLLEKYPNVEEWDFMKTQKAWKDKVKKYGPIAIAIDQEKNQPVYVILDVDF